MGDASPLLKKVGTLSRRVPNISQSFTYKMATEINWHRYGTKLRHWHPMYNVREMLEVYLKPCSRQTN